MVEQEQLSGMDLLLVQQHLLIISPWVRANQIQYNGAEDYAHITAPVWNSKFLE
jgi:hypothetical protein